MNTKWLATAAFAIAAVSVGSAAEAAGTLVLGTCTVVPGSETISCTQGVDSIGYSGTVPVGNVTDDVFFSNTLSGLYNIVLSTATIPDFNYTSVALNGTTLWTGSSILVTLLNVPITAGNNYDLTINGTSDLAGSNSGTVQFTMAVPEPATWAMMLLGFGCIGFAMRRRRVPSIAQLA